LANDFAEHSVQFGSATFTISHITYVYCVGGDVKHCTIQSNQQRFTRMLSCSSCYRYVTALPKTLRHVGGYWKLWRNNLLLWPEITYFTITPSPLNSNTYELHYYHALKNSLKSESTATTIN